MKNAAFRNWLDAKYPPHVASSRFSEACRLEAAYGNLDGHFARDRLAWLIGELVYSAADQASGKPNLMKIEIDGSVKDVLASLRSAARRYHDFSLQTSNTHAVA